jgi:DUF2946 family protein
VRQSAADRPFWQRIVALVAAYAVALSSLLASYGLARAAAATAVPGGVICHTSVDTQQAPSRGSDQSDHCTANCCVGCIMLLATLPPLAKPAGVLPSYKQRVFLLVRVTLDVRPETTSRRSRAPPSSA